jgi:Phospholipase B
VCTLSAAPAPAAIAYYNASQNATGWGFLSVSANPDVATSPEDAAFAMGCAEGVSTYREMVAYWNNYAAGEYGTAGPSQSLLKFMTEQLAWIRSQIATFKSGHATLSDTEATFWQGMSELIAQFDGLVYAHQYLIPSGPSILADEIYMYLLQSVGDLEDLNTLYPNAPTPPPTSTRAMKRQLAEEMPLKDKLLDCSGYVGVLPDFSDVLFSQTTWRSYYAMLRIYKVYSYPWTTAKVIQYSSSPGLLQSKDDFLVTPQFAVFETTNSQWNTTLFDLYTTPQTAFTWQRNAIASLYATSGQEWTTLFALYNSGTYNNQWVVADSNKFIPGQPPLPGFLWIAEQIPGYVHTGDVTATMMARNPNISPETGGGPGNGVWPSYNIPYFQDIYELSGYPAKVAQYGNEYSYEKNLRALIFARNASMVNNLWDARALLRYNNFQNDPLSALDPILGSISSRGDLRGSFGAAGKPVAFGGIDTKALSFNQAFGPGGKMMVIAESGPTKDQEPVFAWANFTSFSGIRRDMVPDVFDFGTVTIWIE